VPTYVYRCANRHLTERFQRMSDPPLETCDECGLPVQKVLHPVAIHFKGSGFYNTDYGRGRGSKDEGSGEARAGDGKSGDGKSGEGASGDRGGGDGKPTSTGGSDSSAKPDGTTSPKDRPSTSKSSSAPD
jgi:putative FmdB family regulatory protein